MSCTSVAARSAGGAADGDLELARQVGEFGVEGRPLAQQLTIRSRILDLIGGNPGQVVEVTLRTQLPEVWMACICTVASSARMSGTSASFGQFSCRFCRVVK